MNGYCRCTRNWNHASSPFSDLVELPIGKKHVDEECNDPCLFGTRIIQVWCFLFSVV